MAIAKLKDGRYKVCVDMGRTLAGKRSRRTRTCATLKAARAAEVELMVAKEGLHGKSDRITLRQFVEDYYLPMKRGVLRKNTLAGYERDIRRIMPAMGSRPVGEIDRMQVQAFLASCPTRGIAENARDTLRGILSEAMQLELIARNPAAGRFKLPERPMSAPKEQNWVSSLSDHLRIIAAARADVTDARSRKAAEDAAEAERLLVLGLCFGLRKGEIVGLDWQAVDFQKRTIRIYQTCTETQGGIELTPPKTERSCREVPMTDLAFRTLADWHGDRPRIGAVITRFGRRMMPARATRVLAAFFRRHPELPRVTCSSMRHSFATAAILSGMNVANVAKWLGHSDVSTTLNRYVRPLQSDLASEAEKLSALYREAAV